MDAINDFITHLAGSPWVYLAVLVVCVIDGFFPPIPSESVVVGLAAVAGSAGEANLIPLIAVAALGAIVGDNIAYQIGRTIGTDRFAWMRRPKVAAAFGWARHSLDRRGALVIFTARYIPVGRIAVNMTAGATGYRRRRFVPLTVVAGISWALYSTLLGFFAGDRLEGQPLLAVGIAIAFAATVGFVVDAITRLVEKNSAREHASASTPD